jgi:hypothetical protein
VEGQLRAGPLVGQGEHGPPIAVFNVGVPVGKSARVGVDNDHVAGGGQAGLQVAQRPADGGVGHGQPQVAGLAGRGVAVQLNPGTVYGLGARARRLARGGRGPR